MVSIHIIHSMPVFNPAQKLKRFLHFLLRSAFLHNIPAQNHNIHILFVYFLNFIFQNTAVLNGIIMHVRQKRNPVRRNVFLCLRLINGQPDLTHILPAVHKHCRRKQYRQKPALIQFIEKSLPGPQTRPACLTSHKYNQI